MAACYPSRPGPDRPFVVAPYVERGKVMVPEMPGRCPWRGPSEEPCSVGIHHWRLRRTGPRFALAVVRCAAHEGGAFTLYPPGYAPYGRQAVLQVAPDGSSVHGEGDRLERDFGGTVFEAALAARDGQAWPRDSNEPPRCSWGTQGRHLQIAASVLGLARNTADRVREAIAAVLSVDVLRLRDGSRRVGYRAVGAAVCDVLARLRGGARRALHLLSCGHLSRRWGEPLQWDARRRVLERLPFQAAARSPTS